MKNRKNRKERYDNTQEYINRKAVSILPEYNEDLRIPTPTERDLNVWELTKVLTAKYRMMIPDIDEMTLDF